MIKLNPIQSDKIWGYEKWIASTHSNGVQKELFELCKSVYPLLVKIIQADDFLSVQVHPDDIKAVELEGKGSSGKTECWYILDAKEGSKIIYGLNKQCSETELEKAINENTLESYLNYVNVKKGDFMFIPSGVVHAIGEGVRILEVQQSCDITYRFYDWGRGREVHVKKGLSSLKQQHLNKVSVFSDFECDYFSLQRIEVKGGWSMFCSGDKTVSADVQLLFVLSEDKAVIRTSADKIGTKLNAEDIYAVVPGEKITVEGKACIMRIRAK